MGQKGRPTTRDVMENEDYGVAPTLRIGIGTPTEITLSALLQRNHDMPDYGVSPLNGRPVDVPRDNFYGFTDDRTIQEVSMLSAEVMHRFDQGAVLRNQLQVNRVLTDARETASQGLGTIDPAKGFVPLQPAGISDLPLDQLWLRLQSHDRVIHDQSVSDQADLTGQLDTGAVHHDLLLGAELGHDTYANQSLSRTGSCQDIALPTGYVSCEPVLAPLYVPSPVSTEVAGNLARSRADTAAAFVGDTAEIGPFKLVGGLRRDHFSASVDNSISTPRSVAQSVDFTSVRAGAIWAPRPAQSYYASYSTSFNPSLEQLTNTTGTTAPLPPEENEAWEAGAKWDFAGDRGSVNAAVFDITKDNARSQNSDGTYSATGTVRVRGVRLGGAGEITEAWKVFAGYAFLDAKIVDGIAVGTQGKVPGNTPRNSATLWTTYAFAPQWEVGGGTVYQSERFANNTNTVQVPGYARWDATVAWHQQQYDVRLNVFNLFDHDYYDNLIQSDGGRAVPGTGRSAMLSVSFHL
jgi:catecholate siderophore receptor